MFFRPKELYNPDNGGVDGFARGLCSQSIQTYDRFVTKQVTAHLFSEHPPEGVGTDLVSLNVQRGRDHGIPGNLWSERELMSLALQLLTFWKIQLKITFIFKTTYNVRPRFHGSMGGLKKGELLYMYLYLVVIPDQVITPGGSGVAWRKPIPLMTWLRSSTRTYDGSFRSYIGTCTSHCLN